MVEWDGQTMADLVRHIHTWPHDNPGDMDRDTRRGAGRLHPESERGAFRQDSAFTDMKEEAKILFTKDKPK